jgi:hypothetical protein
MVHKIDVATNKTSRSLKNYGKGALPFLRAAAEAHRNKNR